LTNEKQKSSKSLKYYRRSNDMDSEMLTMERVALCNEAYDRASSEWAKQFWLMTIDRLKRRSSVH